jgi:cysteine desulfurase/selenocysteine lyase
MPPRRTASRRARPRSSRRSASARRWICAGIGLDAIHAHEAALVARARANSRGSIRPPVRPRGQRRDRQLRAGRCAPHDLGTILDEEGVAIRAGHHCAQPLMDHLGVPATARASFGIYSDDSDIAALVRGIERTMRIFG